MPIFVGDRQIVGDSAGEIAYPRDNASHCTEEALVSALDRLGNGETSANPEGVCRWSEQELAAAPLLNPFTLPQSYALQRDTRSLPCLVSGNIGHPIRTGPVIRTSEVWVMAAEQGWARTYGRLYRLDEPMLPEDAGESSFGGGSQ
jgi:hypothetical protein